MLRAHIYHHLICFQVGHIARFDHFAHPSVKTDIALWHPGFGVESRRVIHILIKWIFILGAPYVPIRPAALERLALLLVISLSPILAHGMPVKSFPHQDAPEIGMPLEMYPKQI